MTKQYPEYDVPKRSVKDQFLSQRWSALVIEGLLVLVAIVVTVGFLTPQPVTDTRDSLIARLEATIAAQEAALVDASSAQSDGVLSMQIIKNMAWDNLSNEEFRSAIAMYNVIIEKDQSDAFAYSARGFAYSHLKEHALAVQDYTKALELDPTLINVYNNRCWSYSELGQYDNALADCNYLMSQYPDADFPYLNRGIVYEMMGNMDAALSDYMEWVNRRGSQAIENPNLAWKGDIEVNMHDGYVYFFPFTVSAGQQVVISATSVGRQVDADPLIIILDPNGKPLTANDDQGDLWDSYVNFVAPTSGEYTLLVTHAGGSSEGTINVAFDFAGQVTLGNDVATFKNTGYSDLMSQDYNGAIDSFQSALSLNSQDAEAMNWLGVTYRYMGDYDTALNHITAAMNMNPDYDLPYLSRGITFELMGSQEASASDYFQYIVRNRTRNFYHVELNTSSQFELPMREGWVYNIPFDGTAGQTLNVDVATLAPGFVDPLIMVLGPDNQPLVGDDDLGQNDYNASINGFTLPQDGKYMLVISHAEGGANGTINVDLALQDAVQQSYSFGCNNNH
jgi:tetratricopeptide (TPR) repeat protein